jgi:hypothetical protein
MANFVRDFIQRNPELAGKGICKRASHSIHFGRGNGETTAVFTGAPMHYLENGHWRAIDTALQESSGGWYSAPHSDVLINPDGRVKITGATHEQFARLPGNPTGYVDGDRIVREFANGVQYLTIKESGFKQEIILNSPPTKAELAYLIPTIKGSLPDKYKVFRTEIRDNGNRRIDYQGKQLKDVFDWLEGAEYPVVIDPDFTASSSDGYISSGVNDTYSTVRNGTAESGQTTDEIYIGQVKSGINYQIWRAYLLFDTSSIGSTSFVENATLTLTADEDYSDADFDVQIVKCNWSSYDPIDENEADAWDLCLSADADDNIWRNTSGMSVDTNYTSGTLDGEWISKTGTTYYGLRSAEDANNSAPTGDEYITIHQGESATAGYRPKLSVTYVARPAFAMVIT